MYGVGFSSGDSSVAGCCHGFFNGVFRAQNVMGSEKLSSFVIRRSVKI